MPALFGKVNKSVDDLIGDKKWKYGRELSVITTASNGIKLETGAELGADNKSTAFTTLNLAHSIGKLESKAKTDNSGSMKIESDQILKGLNAIFSADHKSAVTGELQYTKDAFNAGLTFGNSQKGALNGVFSFQDFVVGAEVNFDIKAASPLKSVSAAAQYKQKKFQGVLQYSNALGAGSDTVKASYFHNICAKSQVAAQFKYDITKGTSNVVLGLSKALDADTTFKARVQDTGVVGLSLTQALNSPHVKIEVKGECKPLEAGSSTKFGFSLTYGDY